MWTLLLLLLTVGIYRWSRIFAGSVPIKDFPADASGGAAWYQRATRAHANCIENLPVFGAIVFGLYAANATGALVDALAVTVSGDTEAVRQPGAPTIPPGCHPLPGGH